MSLLKTLVTVMDSDCHCHREVTVGEPFTLCTFSFSAAVTHIQGPSGQTEVTKE